VGSAAAETPPPAAWRGTPAPGLLTPPGCPGAGRFPPIGGVIEDPSSSLLELSQLLAAQETVVTVLGRLAESACTVLPKCDGASVTLVDRGRLSTATYTAELALEMDLAQYRTGDGPCIDAIRSAQAVRWSPEETRWPQLHDEARRHHVAEVLSVPLRREGVVLGGLNLYSCTARGFGGEIEQRTAVLLAEQGAVALATAQALAMERHITLALQHTLLPTSLPMLPGYELAVRYLPAGGTPDVGGDWYDAFCVEPGGPISVVVGDVAGHGLDAAALMGHLRTALRAYAVEGHSPSETLVLLSRLLAVTEPDRDALFATACVVLLDPQTGMCRVANAGHLPPAVRQPDGDVSFVTAVGGLPLGIESAGAIGEEFVALAPGAVMVLFTDGLVEERHVSLDVGLTALCHVLQEDAVSPERLCDRLLEAMFSDRAQEDDVAIVVLRRLDMAPTGPGDDQDHPII
jgi:serine phosphatase RsbU (regulator of sigma subunit)